MTILQCTIVRTGRMRYHLQVTYDRGIVRRIDLDGAYTLGQAHRAAILKGYDTSYWMHAGDQRVMEIA